MLRIVALIFAVSLLLVPAFVRADFFEEKNTAAQEIGCGECESQAGNLNMDLKEKVTAIEKTISRNLNKKDTHYDNGITLFIDPDGSFCDAAVKGLVKFKKDNPGWKVKGIILTNGMNLKEKLLKKRNYFINDIEFSIDLSGNLAKQFDILKAPAYVITCNNRYYKIAGQPDLNETISKLNK